MAPDEPVVHLSLAVADLDESRRFYVEAFGCDVGRVRDDWIDVWFFGMQLTLQHRPNEVRPVEEQGVQHFGVVIPDLVEYLAVVERLRSADVDWLSEPAAHDSPSLSGKVGGKLADPSGNVIEVKHYDDVEAYRGVAGS